MNEIKYLIDGSAVHIVEALKSGFLVEKLYSYDNEEIGRDDPILVPQVFDVAPTEVLDKRVATLETRIKELEAKRKELDQKARESETAIKETAAKLAQNQKLSKLMDFIDGKITHYVEDDYCGPRIVEFKDAVVSDDYDRYQTKKLKLLTLFGSSKGELNWNLSAYSDGSGSGSYVWPTTSYEEALEILGKLLLSKMEKNVGPALIKIADKYKIAISDEYRNSAKEKVAKNLRERIAKLGEDSAKLENELAALGV